jgi:predicted nucleic acid-binding protein
VPRGRGRGRPPLARGVYSIEDPGVLLVPPSDAVLDTSFVAHALIPTQPLHDPCRRFLERLAEAGVTIYFDRVLELELVETAFNLALRERFGRRQWQRARYDGRARRRAGRLMEQARDAWEKTLDAFDYVRVEPEEVFDRVPELMSEFGLSSYDAVHAAAAAYLGVEHMVTLDTGFALLPRSQLTLYTSAGRVAVCRSRRAGA